MKRYGLPYQGSKNKIADWVIDVLPSATHLYDVFAGGCAISHAAILSGKWKCVHFSDINDSVTLFHDCLKGNAPDGSEWISRDEFFKRKDNDPYVRIVWSFSNNQRDYVYSREIEPYKKLVHEMLFSPTPQQRRLKFKEVCRMILDMKNNRAGNVEVVERAESIISISSDGFHKMQNIEAAERCVDVENLFRLSSSERNDSLKELRCESGKVAYEVSIADYRTITPLPDSIIYCDIPYYGRKGYKKDKFDHESFYRWCESQTHPVFISEYWMPEERFTCIAERSRTSSFSSTNNGLKEVERIYIPNHQIGKYESLK